MSEKLESEKVIVSAPMSFSGSSARIWKITDSKNIWLKMLLIPTAIVATVLSWFVILIWYVIFGILLVPYRLIRRGSRKQKKLELQHREVLEEIQDQNK